MNKRLKKKLFKKTYGFNPPKCIRLNDVNWIVKRIAKEGILIHIGLKRFSEAIVTASDSIKNFASELYKAFCILAKGGMP